MTLHNTHQVIYTKLKHSYYCTECINASQHPGNPCVQEPELGHLTSGVATAESCAAGTVKAVMMKIHRCDLPMM